MTTLLEVHQNQVDPGVIWSELESITLKQDLRSLQKSFSEDSFDPFNSSLFVKHSTYMNAGAIDLLALDSQLEREQKWQTLLPAILLAGSSVLLGSSLALMQKSSIGKEKFNTGLVLGSLGLAGAHTGIITLAIGLHNSKKIEKERKHLLLYLDL